MQFNNLLSKAPTTARRTSAPHLAKQSPNKLTNFATDFNQMRQTLMSIINVDCWY